MSRPMYVLGVDENGLGPRLGPLVTTAVLLRLPKAYDEVSLRESGLRSGLTDSKAVASSRAMRFCEGVALALSEVEGEFLHASELLNALHVDGAVGLRTPCPDAATSALCHGSDKALPAFGGDRASGAAALRDVIGPRRATLVRARTVVSCVGVLNAQLGRGVNKLVVDLSAMERLVEDARRVVDVRGGGDLLALCGMVGGIRDVPKFFTRFPADRVTTLTATRQERHYRVDGVGEVRFDVDADARHLPVALASLLGKYVRELAMGRVVDFHRAHEPDLAVPSGYHDPVTDRFVRESEPIRRRLAIDPACFERRG